MADVPSPLFKLNYPIETDAAKKFWASALKANRAKAIIAFSLDISNANDNLRRFHYTRHFRKRALFNYCMYVNNPSMSGIPFSDGLIPWWTEMPYRESPICNETTKYDWDDMKNWDDSKFWEER